MLAAFRGVVDWNAKDQNGRTGLMLALLENQKEVARFLMEQDSVDINIIGVFGDTALHWVAWRDNRSTGHNCYLRHIRLKIGLFW